VRNTMTHLISSVGFAREHERKSAARHKSGEQA
jgi:hypothetical protein